MSDSLPSFIVPLLVLLFGIGFGLVIARFMRGSSSSQSEAPKDPMLQAKFDQLAQAQMEIQGRIASLNEGMTTRQFETSKQLSERMDQLSMRLGQSMTQSTQTTMESLSKLNERMAVIDAAQARLGELSQSMVSLQDILSNKQSRGAFGQVRMEAIVRDALPKEAYSFQATLSNGKRPDCLITLPDAKEKLAVDAKFPLESFTAFNDAHDPEQLRAATAKVRQDINKHLKDIAERYLIPGETQDVALMFVPSESTYAQLYESFDDLMQEAHRKRVLIVGPSLLMLAVQLMQSMVRDARMREQAGLIQKEVMVLLKDVDRLDERVGKLQSHFAQANRDIDDILISSKKIRSRSVKIEQVEVQTEERLPSPTEPSPSSQSLRLSAASGDPESESLTLFDKDKAEFDKDKADG